MTEASWAYEFNELFRKEYSLRTPLRAVFIDTYYDPKNPKEASKFQENTDKLWNFAKNNNPFECKDIKIALTEIRELNNEINVSSVFIFTGSHLQRVHFKLLFHFLYFCTDTIY